jgi:hypothetical protein
MEPGDDQRGWEDEAGFDLIAEGTLVVGPVVGRAGAAAVAGFALPAVSLTSRRLTSRRLASSSAPRIKIRVQSRRGSRAPRPRLH